MRILLADDEKEMLHALESALRTAGYSTDTVTNGQDACDYGLDGLYDCLVLDVMMPRLDGMEVVRRLRRAGVSTPILLLTAKSSVEDRIAGLNCGADDYLPKPFDMGEFLARVRALARRRDSFSPDILQMGNIRLNKETGMLGCGDKEISLGNKEFQMLELMLHSQGHYISTEQFMERIWGYDSDCDIHVVWSFISYLRKKLQELDADVCITASRGRGYMLEVV